MTKNEKQGMKYLVRKRAGGVVHVWSEGKTLCPVSETSGVMLIENYEVADELPAGRNLCARCLKMREQHETLK